MKARRLWNLGSKSSLLIVFFYFTSFTSFSQVVVQNVPTHLIRPPVYSHEGFRSPAYIDSALFFRYLDWALQKDSLPPQYKQGQPFSITVNYIVSKEGKLSDV